METCQGSEPVSSNMMDNYPGDAKDPSQCSKHEPSEASKAGAATVWQKAPTRSLSGVFLRKSGVTVSEGQNVTTDSADSSKRPTPQFLEGLEHRFEALFEVLCSDDKTSRAAMQLFKESKRHLIASLGVMGTGNVEEAANFWYACILFAVKSLSNKTASDNLEDGTVAGFTLSQILKATKLRLIDFFKEIPQILAKVGPELTNMYGEDWEKRLQAKELQADVYYLAVLFNYYKRVYNNLFCDEGSRVSVSGSFGGRVGTSIHMRFGWMLFLALRMRVLSRFMDLVTYINGLLAVVIIMILHMPPSLRKFTFEDEAFFKERSADGRVKLVASLCSRYHDASEEDVSSMVEKASSMIGELFRKNSSFRTRSHAEQLAGIDTEGLAYFEGLMDERSVSANLRIVERDYEEAYQSRGELDERMFINGDENCMGALSAGTPSTSSGSKRKYEAICSPNQGTASAGVCPSSPSSPCSSPSTKPCAAAPVSKLPAATPVSVTMSTVKWLRTVISPLPAVPSPELQQYFLSCDQDITTDVTHRSQVLLQGIFSTAGTSKLRDCKGPVVLDRGWAGQRRQEALKLYYKVLTGMCKAESQRLGSKNLTSLLTNERFHRCMIACSAELVLYTHKTVKMTFPAVLEPAGITAFDLSKVIESFVRYEETLPRELKRHLNSMEQQILESMAWEKGSSMYNSLIVAKKHLAGTINRLGLLAEPMPSLDSLGQQNRLLSGNSQQLRDGAVEGSGASGSPQRVVAPSPKNAHGLPGSNGLSEVPSSFRSPVKERLSAFSVFTSLVKNRIQHPLQSAFASPQRPSPLGGGETCAETVINVFFQKVLKLAAVRIKDLCGRLQQSNDVWYRVYKAMQHILHKETSLFFNRHIDQLILCSIYGVCKVRKADVTFKKCIEQYGKQPQCKSHVFRNVYIDMPVRGEVKSGQGTGDIIKFYNEVFVPATKAYLQHLGSNAVVSAPMTSGNGDEDRNESEGPGSPKVPSFVALPDMSPKKVSAAHNVFVSPLRATKVETIMSPHTRSLYACVGESTHAYQSPSKDLSAINHRLNTRRGRLDFTDAACDSRLVSDSLVAGSLYPCPRNGNHHATPAWTMAAALPPSPLKRPRPDR